MKEEDPKEFDLENGAIVARLSGGHFTELQIDFDEQCLFAVGEVAGIGRMRVSFAIAGFDPGLSFGEADAAGMVSMSAAQKLSVEDLHAGMVQIDQLNQRWSAIWPDIFQSILDTRMDYEKPTRPTPANTKLKISAPGIDEDDDSEDWGCELELSPFDGGYCVFFSLDGEIFDSGVVF